MEVIANMIQKIPCDTVGKLVQLLKGIPEGTFIRVNGKKALFYDNANTYTVYLESAEDDSDTLYGF